MATNDERFKVERLIDPIQLKKDLTFSPVNLSDAMMTQASMYAHYATISAAANKQVDDLKMKMEIVEARLDKMIRDAAVDEGKKTTEAQIAKEIGRSRDYVVGIKAVNDARMIADLAKSSLEAFRQRRDMLVQLGVMAREEMKGELTIAERKDRERKMFDKKTQVEELMRPQ